MDFREIKVLNVDDLSGNRFNCQAKEKNNIKYEVYSEKQLYSFISKPNLTSNRTRNIMYKKILSLLVFILLNLSIYANDTAGTILPTGGIVFEKQDGIKMKVEALYIRPWKVEVNYIFENTTDLDITTQVFFPLPKMPAVEQYWGEETHDYHFKLWVNGNPQKVQTHWTITQNDKDITQYVFFLFWRPEEVITEQKLSQRLHMLFPELRQKLIEENIIEWGWTLDRDEQEVQNWKMPDNASWKKQVSYSWEQTFPAQKTVSIRHVYIPTAIHNSAGYPYSKCIDFKSSVYRKFALFPEDEPEYTDQHLYARNYLEYILTTANNWQGPIENFNLLIESPLKSVGCFDGKAFYAENQFAVNRRDYTPRWDLSAEFLVNRTTSLPQTNPDTPILYRVDGPANVRQNPNGKIIGQFANDTYVWVWPNEEEGNWHLVMQNQIRGYTHKQNLIKVF